MKGSKALLYTIHAARVPHAFRRGVSQSVSLH